MFSIARATLLALTLSAAVVLPALAQGDDPVVARVNGADIRRSTVMQAISNLPPQYQQMPKDVLFNTMLRQLIDRKLIAAAAEKAKIEDTPEFKKRLADARERLMQEVWLSTYVDSKMTDALIKERYDAAVKAMGDREEVRARHILTSDEETAKKAIAEIEKGAPFAEVAKKYSKDGSAGEGGDLGYFTRDMMVKEFSDAAFALKKGEITKTPVKSQFGYHVIQVEDRRKQPPPSLEQFKEEIKQEVAQELIMAKLDELRKDAKIEEFDENGKPRAKK